MTYMFILKCTLKLVLKNIHMLPYSFCILVHCRSKLPRVLRRGSAADCVLGLWVRIPLRVRISVCCECCVLSGTGLCIELNAGTEESH